MSSTRFFIMAAFAISSSAACVKSGIAIDSTTDMSYILDGDSVRECTKSNNTFVCSTAYKVK